MALIVEVLDARTGDVRARHRLDGAAAITVGRGYDNDVILDDPYADARHARIAVDETGAIVVDDLGSVNQLVTGDDARQARIVARPGDEVRIGRTRLRFRDPGAPLPPALPDARSPAQGRRLPRWAGTWWGQLAVALLVAGAAAWGTWLGSYQASPASEAVGVALGVLMLTALWAGVWAVAGRIVVQRFRFLAHLAVASAFLFAVLAIGVAESWQAFLFPDTSALDLVTGALASFLIAALVATHLALASTLNRRRRWIAGAVTTAVMLAIGAAAILSEDQGFSDVPSFSGVLKPLPVRWVPTITVDQFADVAADLAGEVDALAAEE